MSQQQKQQQRQHQLLVGAYAAQQQQLQRALFALRRSGLEVDRLHNSLLLQQQLRVPNEETALKSRTAIAEAEELKNQVARLEVS